MKVTTKGQVTIPLALRTKTGMLPGSEVEFIEKRGQLYLRKIKGSGRGAGLVTRMTGHGKVKLRPDEILALTRGSD